MIPPERPHAATLFVVLTLTYGLLGCATARTPPPGADLDDWIRGEVVHQFGVDDAIDASDIRVECRNGVVVLAGIVTTVEEARRAIELAGSVDGVQQVVNRLRIVPLTSTARELQPLHGLHDE